LERGLAVSYHIDILAYSLHDKRCTVAARLILHDQAGVLVEAVDEALTERLLAPATDGFGGLVTHRDNPKLFLTRLMQHQPIFMSPEEDVIYLAVARTMATAARSRSVPPLMRFRPRYRAAHANCLPRKGARCSFCGSTHDQVQAFIAGPGIRICDACVDLCNEIIEELVPTWHWRNISGP
jgi:hypothetical protein